MAGKSYGQFCGLARALDVVGDRWSLLIVRELLIGPARFGQLRAGLTTIATNLLADRLKDLETHGVIERRLASDVNAIVYALTPWGQELREPVEALIRWSGPLMSVGRNDDLFDPRWLVPALQALFANRRAETSVAVLVFVENTSIEITVDADGPHVCVVDRAAGRGEAVLRATPEAVLAMAAGVISPDEVLASKAGHTNDPATIHAVFAIPTSAHPFASAAELMVGLHRMGIGPH
jgi:DNA-binding HxlR family transcriptional regulator